MSYEDMRERALESIEKNKDRNPPYPQVMNGLCEHCEAFYRDTCPLHKPKPATQAYGLRQEIKTKRRWWKW